MTHSVDGCNLCILLKEQAVLLMDQGLPVLAEGILVVRCRRCAHPLAVYKDHEPDNYYTAKADLERVLRESVATQGRTGTVEIVQPGQGHYRAHLRLAGPAYQTMPQVLSDDLAYECQRAVAWFHNHDDVYLGDPSVREISDEEVEARVLGYQYAMDKEIARYSGGRANLAAFTQMINEVTYEGYEDWIEVWEEFHQSDAFVPLTITSRAEDSKDWYDRTSYSGNPLRFDLRNMPFSRQRALVQNWERIWADFLDAHPEYTFTPFGFIREGTPYAPATAAPTYLDGGDEFSC